MSCSFYSEPGAGEVNNPSPQAELSQSQHILVCGLLEMGSLLKSLGATALPLVSENQNSMSVCSLFVRSVCSATHYKYSVLLVAGVQLYNRYFVSVRQSVRPERFSEPVGVRKLKFGTKEIHTTVQRLV